MRRSQLSEILHPSTSQPLCGPDPTVTAMVHRFDPGQRQCRCGDLVVPDPSQKDRTRPIANHESAAKQRPCYRRKPNGEAAGA